MQLLIAVELRVWIVRCVHESGRHFPTPMKKGFGATDRVDKWWKGPTASCLSWFYDTLCKWRGFMEADFGFSQISGLSAGVGHGAGTMAIEDTGSHVLSPLYSPLIVPGEHSWVPQQLQWLSPAMFILIFPAGFRATCYYYRKAYYRAFMAQPTGCAVSKPWDEYSGETEF